MRDVSGRYRGGIKTGGGYAETIQGSRKTIQGSGKTIRQDDEQYNNGM
jgi:hypothetical protein